MRGKSLLFILASSILISCSAKDITRTSIPETYPSKGDTQIGIASWYGDKEHNRQAASGERFSKYAYTAAHRSLPMGTVVRVTNLENGRDVVVRINDRGPFVGGRIIDLSEAAAKSIGMIRHGTAKVKIGVISVPGRTSNFFDARYTVQVGSFTEKDNAVEVKRELNRRSNEVRVETVEVRGDKYHRVRVGRFADREDAERVARELRRDGYSVRVILE